MVDDRDNADNDSPRIIDELEFEPVTHQMSGNGLPTAVLLTLVLLAVVGGAGWYFLGDKFRQWFPENKGDVVQFIRADTTPIKVRPKDPGGMDVPNRDKLIYGRLRGAGDAPPLVERLMPPAESPLPVPKPKPSSPPVVSNDKPSAGTIKSLEAAVLSLKVERPTVPPTDEVVATAPPTSPPPVSQPSADKKSKTAKSEEFQIQVGAVRLPDGAKSEWHRLKRKNPKLLGNLELFITKVDLGQSKGVFYRLRAGPIADEASARGICKELARRKIGCLIVRPGE